MKFLALRNELITPVPMHRVRIASAQQILTMRTTGEEAATALKISILAPAADVGHVFRDLEDTGI